MKMMKKVLILKALGRFLLVEYPSYVNLEDMLKAVSLQLQSQKLVPTFEAIASRLNYSQAEFVSVLSRDAKRATEADCDCWVVNTTARTIVRGRRYGIDRFRPKAEKRRLDITIQPQ